jgi:charged multivesicular body protein 6
VIERETEIARQLLQQAKKKQALLALKKKKYQEGLIEKTEGQLNNLEEMVEKFKILFPSYSR